MQKTDIKRPSSALEVNKSKLILENHFSLKKQQQKQTKTCCEIKQNIKNEGFFSFFLIYFLSKLISRSNID